MAMDQLKIVPPRGCHDTHLHHPGERLQRVEHAFYFDGPAAQEMLIGCVARVSFLIDALLKRRIHQLPGVAATNLERQKLLMPEVDTKACEMLPRRGKVERLGIDEHAIVIEKNVSIGGHRVRQRGSG